ncbi:response regulator MprA [bacterium BMS3Bbin02]|nr:response regulator MprA [bacterium BMS3Bbin02]
MTRDQASILVAEDDPAIRDAVERALAFEGFNVLTANDGAAALEQLRIGSVDLVLLDILMPHLDGLETCRLIRSRGITTPVLMLTARHEVSDRVAGLDAGADDYLVKPFALEELLARIRALLRRSGGTTTDVLRVGDLTMNSAARTVSRGDTDISLTKTEFDLLALLVKNAGIVIPRSRIYEEIWGYDFDTSSNPLEVYVGYIRRKTEEGGLPRIVQTVRGVGYVARVDP